MKFTVKILIPIFVLSIFFTACNTDKKVCAQETKKLKGEQPGFHITKVLSHDANTLKLALGKYSAETETVIEVRYSTDAEVNNSCYFLYDSNDKVLNEDGKIDYPEN